MQPLESNPVHRGPRLATVAAGTDEPFVPEQDPPAGLPIAEYWNTLKRYRWSILGIAFIAAVVGVMNAVSTVSLYQAHARLLVKFNQPNISNVQQFEPMPLHWLFFQTQADIIKSRAVAERVIKRLQMSNPIAEAPRSRETAAGVTAPDLGARLRAWASELRTWLPAELRPPERPPMSQEAHDTVFVNSVLGALSVQGGKESEVLVVSYVSPDPAMAATFANAFAEAYIDFGLESRVSTVQQATSWLAQRIEELRAKVLQSEQALRAFQAREDLVDTENREKIISAKLGTLTAELVKAQSRRSEAEARFTQIRTFLAKGNDYEFVAEVLNNAILLEAQRTRVELERRVSELSERYGERHPKMIAARAELEEARRRLKVESEKAVNTARKEYELAASQEREFNSMIAEQQAQMRSVSGKAFELKQLEREVEANRELYETFLARLKEADVASEYNVPIARIIDRAAIPTTPFQPNRKRIVFIALLLGLGVGVALAFLRDHLDNTFKTKDDVEEKLKLPVIGMLPRIRSRRGRLHPVEREYLNDARGSFAEAVNDIRTAVLFSHIDASPKVIMVTSAVPSEGKTTLASNLALAFSMRGRTLLIEADLRKGRLHHIAGREPSFGLTDLLSGTKDESETILPDANAENLSLLLAGTMPPNPLEVISSRRFADLLEALRSRFDYVVIDGTPVLPVSDGIVLGRLVDSIILTVKADSTTRDATMEAVKRIQAARLRSTGVVLQQVDLRKMRSYGRRYVGSYTGYYGYHAQRPY